MLLGSATLAFLPAGELPTATAQAVDLANRPVAAVRFEGLKLTAVELVQNQVRLHQGDPYDAAVVREDIVRLTHLGRFASVDARVEPQADGSVAVTYVVQELAILADVVTVGNKHLSDQELAKLTGLRSGDPVDPFLIQRAINQMTQAYEKDGYFQCQIAYDKDQLAQSGLLVFKVREGALAKIRAVHFEGNHAFDSDQLYAQIKSRTAWWFFRKGEVSREQLEGDAAKLRDFYRDAGYLEAQVGRRIDLSPDQQDAVVVFVVLEGPQYTVDRIIVEGNEIFGEDQILAAMAIKSGDVFTAARVKESYEAVQDLYGKLGFIEVKVARGPDGKEFERLFHPNEPKVDLVVRLTEGRPYHVGKLTVAGNLGSQDKTVLREVRGIEPGRRFDLAGIDKTEQRLKESALFSDAHVTKLGGPQDDPRDVVVQVKEKQTGNLAFGAALSSDSGVLGSIDVTQRNFDITDLPESWGEFFTAQAFRGAGQTFNLAIEPGVDTSRYSISLQEPSFLESNFFVDGNAFYYSRHRDTYDESRFGVSAGLGQRLGDIWSASVRLRGEDVTVDSIDPKASQDVFDVQGSHPLTTGTFSVVRNTTDSALFPTHGSLLQMAFTQAGVAGGDYTYSAVSASFTKFWTVDEDFFGYKTIVVMRGQAGYIFNSAQSVPLFERYYAGGRNFRGFDFEGVGPRGLKVGSKTDYTSDHVGGTWLFLWGLEYNFPIYQDLFRGVVFTDTGTVADNVGFDQYRVTVGAGIRLKLPILGQAPFALDFAVPLMKESGDDTRLISFDISLPFR